MKAILYPPGGGPIIQRSHGTPDAIAQVAAYLGADVLESDDETAVAVDADKGLVQPAASLDERRALRIEQAKGARDARKAAGFDAPGFGRVSTDTQQSILRIYAALAAGAAAMAAKKTMPMKDFPLADGSRVDLTPAKAVTMGLGATGMLDACDQAYDAIETQINAAADPAAISVTAGYPA